MKIFSIIIKQTTAQLMNHHNYVNENTQFVVGDTLVFDNAVTGSGSTSYGFLRVNSLTDKNTPRVSLIKCIVSNQISSAQSDTIEYDVAPDLTDNIDRENKTLQRDHQGFFHYTNKDNGAYSCNLELYDPNVVYHSIRLFN